MRSVKNVSNLSVNQRKSRSILYISRDCKGENFMKKFIFALLLTVLLSPVVLSQTVTTLGESFNGSGGIAIDAEGNIYVADFGAALNNANGTQVWKITPDGERTEFATGLQGASGNVFDNDGNLLQSNIAGSTVSRITPNGTVSTFVSDGIRGPVGVTVDKDDNVYVSNCGNSTIRKVTPDGVSTSFALGPLFTSCPNGLTIDNDGNVYAGTFGGGRVIKITPEGTSSLLANVPGSSIGHLAFANDRLYVVSRGNNSIYELTLNGTLTKIAGTGSRGNADGPALQATFSVPNGIGVSPDGTKIYISSAVPLNGPNLNPVLIRVIDLSATAESISNVEQSALTLPTLSLSASSSQSSLSLDNELSLVACAVACLAGK